MKKTRAQQDAERLAELEEAQNRIDSGAPAATVVAGLGLDVEGAPPASGGDSQMPEARQSAIDDGAHAALVAEIANLKRTVSLYEQEVKPAQRRAQDLEREVEALRAQLAQPAPAPDGPLDYGLDEEESEFVTVRSIAEKIAKKLSAEQTAKIEKQLADVRATLAKYEDASREMDVQTAVSKHRADLAAALGGDDPDSYFNHPRIAAWADNQSDEESLALRNPIAYSPKFVAGVLTRFKAEVIKGPVKRDPSHGESAVPSRVAPDVISRRDGVSGDDPVFNPETFQADVQQLITNKQNDEAARLVAIAERAMSSQ